jgi:hypothetical protein
MENKPQYVLFYMDNCKFCAKFINELKSREELFQKFNAVNILKVPRIPDEVDELPCVYDGKSIFKGTKAFLWLNEEMLNYLSPANDGLNYAFLDGQEEKIFGNFALLDQKSGSFGIMGGAEPGSDPTRMSQMNDNTTNKNMTLEAIMAMRDRELL